MESIFGDYTTSSKVRIQDIVRKVNDMALSCKNITTDKSNVTINLNGQPYRATKEEEYFINKTNEFRRRLRNGETIDDIMVEALAIVREAVRRRLNMFPYNVQIEAAVSMLGEKIDSEHRDRVIAEMKTGEGKTLVQILVAYLNVLEATKDEDRSKWTSVHIITSNDALAKRDQQGNDSVFKLLGISTGFVPSRRATRTNNIAQMRINKEKKRKSYNCDIVYATATTIAFDYLEDNTIYDARSRNINRRGSFAIVDEADDILIDQATNPLKLSHVPNPNGTEFDKSIISREESIRSLYRWATEYLYGKSTKRPLKATIFDQYYINREKIEYNEFNDYAFIKESKEVFLSDRVLREIGYGLTNSKEDDEIYNARLFALINCIKAKEGFANGVEYKVEEKDGVGSIIIIDQNLGRKKYSNKYKGGMQEAIEAKEEFLEQDLPGARKRYHVEYSRTVSTTAMCTYPDFISTYDRHVCGMTGTSDEEEFRELYGFQTYRVRERKRNIRIDEEREVYATLKEKHAAIIEEVRRCSFTGQPILIGTTSLRESEIISSLLAQNYIRHQLLNANNEEEENQIIEGAGMFGTVTIATNMAGRGTDIKLGPGVRELGGLYVIGTSNNKSTRIDRQLKGRAGRQGDPGKTKYYASLEDDLVKEYYKGGVQDSLVDHYRGRGRPITNKKVLDAVDSSQSSRESKDKAIRKSNEMFSTSFKQHRRIIYENRNLVLDSNLDGFMNMVKGIITKYVDVLINDKNSKDEVKTLIGHLVDVNSIYSEDSQIFRQKLIFALWDVFRSNFSQSNVTNKEVKAYVDNVRQKFLNVIDQYWLSHIEYLEDLRTTISINPIGDPYKEYEVESIKAFTKDLLPSMYNEMITYALRPTMKYGSYRIDYSFKEEENQVL